MNAAEWRTRKADTLQACIDAAYARAVESGADHYVYGGGAVCTPPYHVTACQPSRFRSHYRVTPAGDLGSYRTPRIDGVACDLIPPVAYTPIL